LLELRHSNRVFSAEFNMDGSLIVTASADFTARIWDAATSRQKGPSLQHDAEVYHAEFDHATRRVATVFKDKTVRIWSVQTGQMLTLLLVHADSLQSKDSVVFNPDGSRLASAAGNAVQVWDAATGQAIITPLRHGGLVRRIQFSPDGRKLLTASEDGIACL